MARAPHAQRWRSLGVGLVVQSVSGLFYAFSLYSPVLRKVYKLTQDQTALLATCGNLGGNVGVHVGFFYDRFGPRVTMLLAATLGFSSWAVLWAGLSGHLQLSYGTLMVVSFVQGHSQLIGDLGVIPTIAKNFPEHRGQALGMAKSFVGLSGAMASATYLAAFAPPGESTSGTPSPAGMRARTAFCLFIAFEFGMANLTGARFVRLPPDDEAPPAASAAPPRRRFAFAFSLVYAVVAIISVGVAIRIAGLPPVGAVVASIGVCVATYGAFAWLVLGLSREDPPKAASLADADAVPPVPPSLAMAGDAPPRPTVNGERVEGAGRQPGSERPGSSLLPADGGAASDSAFETDMTVRQALTSIEIVLLASIVFLGCGSGLVLINNLAQIHVARGGAGEAPVFVSVLSAANCCGRLIAGWASDLACRRWPGLPRPFAMAVACLIMSLSMLVLWAFGGSAPLYIACISGGMAYGAMNVLNPAISSEVFGLQALGSIYPFVSVGIFLGSYVFATRVMGAVYDAALARHGLPRDATCAHPDCFEDTYLICAGVALLGALVSVALGYKSRPRYLALLRMSAP